MNWKEWAAWKEKKYIAAALFVIAYVLTIPWRNYEKLLGGFIDISQGVPIWAHLILIVIALAVLITLLKILEIIVKRMIR